VGQNLRYVAECDVGMRTGHIQYYLGSSLCLVAFFGIVEVLSVKVVESTGHGTSEKRSKDVSVDVMAHHIVYVSKVSYLVASKSKANLGVEAASEFATSSDACKKGQADA